MNDAVESNGERPIVGLALAVLVGAVAYAAVTLMLGGTLRLPDLLLFAVVFAIAFAIYRRFVGD